MVQSRINGSIIYGMMNIGTNPTVGGSAQTIETYFFDFNNDLYGQQLEIQLLDRIRDEKNFGNVDELIKAMKADEVYARNYINKH